MSARLLVIITEGQEAAALGSLAAMVAVARAERASVRLAYVRRLPAARLDGSDRIVVPAELEMERIEAAAVTALGAAARAFDDVDVHPVVRFGRPRRELALEVDAFQPDLVMFLTSCDAGPVERLRAWALRRGLSRHTGVRVLVWNAPRLPRRVVAAGPPRWWRDIAREPR